MVQLGVLYNEESVTPVADTHGVLNYVLHTPGVLGTICQISHKENTSTKTAASYR